MLSFSMFIVFLGGLYWNGVSSMCMPEHPQTAYCRAGFGKFGTKFMSMLCVIHILYNVNN